MRIVKSFISLYGLLLLSAVTICPVCFTQSIQKDPLPIIDVPSLLGQTNYKYVEVRKGLWKIPDISYKGKNLDNLIIFLEPNPYNKTLRISFRLGFLRSSVETAEFKEKLNDLSKRFKPTEFVFSEPVVFVVTEPPADKLDKDMLEKAIKELADVSDQAYSELTKFIELDFESRKMGMGAGAGPGGYSPSILKNPEGPENPDSPKYNIVRDVDSKPEILNRVLPGYTEEARRDKIQGVVTLRILIDETGEVKQVRVIKGLPDGLSERAMAAAKQTKFKPAMKDGKAVAYWTVIQMTFNLY